MTNLLAEISSVWNWIGGIIAGWGLTFTIMVIALVLAFVKITRLYVRINKLEERVISETRDLSLRLRKLEK
jgi:hypothetical protein